MQREYRHPSMRLNLPCESDKNLSALNNPYYKFANPITEREWTYLDLIRSTPARCTDREPRVLAACKPDLSAAGCACSVYADQRSISSVWRRREMCGIFNSECQTARVRRSFCVFCRRKSPNLMTSTCDVDWNKAESTSAWAHILRRLKMIASSPHREWI